MSILYTHAQKIVDEDPKQCGLWLGTGSTKTRIALFLARGSTLVIAPKTQVEDRNWEREVQKIRKEMPKFHIDLTVISKETFKTLHKSGGIKRYDTVIVDEAHTCLGATPNIRYVKKQAIPKCSQIYEELGIYLMLTKPDRLYLCTATIVKSPMTVWAAGKLLGKNWDFYAWRDVFYVKLPMPGREVWAPRKDSATKDRLARNVRTLGYTGQLSDYFDVPAQTYKRITVELTQKQAQRIREAKYDWPDPIVQVGKRHQIENGILAGDDFNEPEIFDNAKIEAILDIAVEFPHFVIFAKYTAQIAQIALALRESGRKVLTLEGATTDRGSVITEANACILDSIPCVLIAQAQISAGWELPLYPVMVFSSMSYSVVDRIQGEGRILRANHLKKNLYIDITVRGGVDEAVYKAIEDKKDFNERTYLKI